MAIDYKGTSLEFLPASLLPDGYVKPTITKFADFENAYIKTSFTVLKSSVHNAAQDTSVNDLIAQLDIDILAVLAADKNAAASTEAFAEVRSIRTNMTKSEAIWTDGATNYVVVVEIYVKTT